MIRASKPCLHTPVAMLLAAVLAIALWWATGQPAYANPITKSETSQEADEQRPANRAAYAALLAVLENDETRDQLLEQLRELSGQAAEASEAAVDTDSDAASIDTTDTADRLPITTRLQRIASKIRQDTSISWFVVKKLVTGQRVPGVTLESWTPAFMTLVFVILASVFARLVLGLPLRATLNRLARWVSQQHSEAPRRWHSPRLRGLTQAPHGRRLLASLTGLAVEFVVIFLASVAGYATAIFVSSTGQGMSLFAMLFLAAFFAAELLIAVSRMVFGIRRPALRLIPMGDTTANYWHRWFSLIVSTTGYTLLLVVPVVQTVLTPSVGRLLGLILMLVIFLYAISVIWAERHKVRDNLLHYAETSEASTVLGTLIRIVARIWHWLLLVYLTVLFVVSQTEQQAALSFMAAATLQTAVALAVGALLIAGISSLTSRRFQLAGDWHRTLPSLEDRINTYAPIFLRGLRLLVIVLVALTIIDAWRAFNLIEWLQSTAGQRVISMIIHVGIILLIATLSWTILASMIEHRLGMTHTRRRPSEREKTLLLLFRNASAITIATLTVLIVLSQIGIDIGPLLAGAGVAGLAIGFGAQKLVQDVITGIFIQLENGMNQNDVVEVAGLFGTVEKVTIRSVVIRTLDGGYHLIPFSAIDRVSNHTRDYGYHYGEYAIAHRESVEDAVTQLHAAFDDLMQDPEIAAEVLEEITIPGVTSLNEHGFTVRVMIKTTPGNQWVVQRAFNRKVKEHFDAAGIEIPYPQTVVHFGRDKHGHAAPLAMHQVEKLEEVFDAGAAPGQTRREVPPQPPRPEPEAGQP